MVRVRNNINNGVDKKKILGNIKRKSGYSGSQKPGKNGAVTKRSSLNSAAEKQKSLINAVERQKSRNFRITVVLWMFLSLITILGLKAVDIQIFESDDLTQKAEREYTKDITIAGKRGDIMDRNGKRLTTTIDTVSVAANPSGISDPVKVSSLLASILKLDRQKLEQQLSTKKSFTWVKRKISPSEADRIRALKINGIFFKDDVIRFHPNRELAAQVIGITGSDGKGLEGIEFQYNNILAGKERKIRITKDAAGRYYNEEKNIREGLKGDSIALTIDSTIQFISESALQKAVEDNGARSGTAIVMKPDTGEILAMANYPTFNPNSFSDYNRDTWRNRAVSDTFEPGSTMKVFVASAIIENRYANPKSLFNCENGAYRVGGATVRDTHKYEWLTLKEIIKYSSNIGAIKLSELMGKKTLSDTLLSFGFGRKTNIEAPGDAPGTLSNYKRWSKIDTAAISFGQGMSASAIQLATGISAIANDGVLLRPRIIKQIISPSGEIVEDGKTQTVRQVISRDSAVTVRDMMRAVVEDGGTATTAAIDGYSVCGKTGTAQKVSESGGYSKDKYTALFAAFAPEKDPKLTVLVVVDEPPRSHYGGIVAAPAVKTILSECFNYLKIPPDMKLARDLKNSTVDPAIASMEEPPVLPRSGLSMKSDHSGQSGGDSEAASSALVKHKIPNKYKMVPNGKKKALLVGEAKKMVIQQ